MSGSISLIAITMSSGVPAGIIPINSLSSGRVSSYFSGCSFFFAIKGGYNLKIQMESCCQLVQLVDKKLMISPQAQQHLLALQHSHPLAVLAVVGKYRTGKSFFLNRVILQSQGNGFKVGPTINPCTKGLWMWRKLIECPQKQCDVLVVDVEGFGGMDQSANHDSKIFLVALLISSYFIYNSVGVIDQNALNNLGLVISLAKQLISKNDMKGVQFPGFMWVLRDFILKLVDRDGDLISQQEYLQTALQLQKGLSDAVQNKNKVRRLISQVFKERDCVTLVRPTEDQKLLQNLQSADFSQLRPEFSSKIKTIRQRIFRKVRPKRLGKRFLTAQGLVDLIKTICKSINEGGVPDLQSTWHYVVLSQNRRIISSIAKQIKSSLLSQERALNEKQVSEFRSRNLKAFRQRFLERALNKEVDQSVQKEICQAFQLQFNNFNKQNGRRCTLFLQNKAFQLVSLQSQPQSLQQVRLKSKQLLERVKSEGESMGCEEASLRVAASKIETQLLQKLSTKLEKELQEARQLLVRYERKVSHQQQTFLKMRTDHLNLEALKADLQLQLQALRSSVARSQERESSWRKRVFSLEEELKAANCQSARSQQSFQQLKALNSSLTVQNQGKAKTLAQNKTLLQSLSKQMHSQEQVLADCRANEEALRLQLRNIKDASSRQANLANQHSQGLLQEINCLRSSLNNESSQLRKVKEQSRQQISLLQHQHQLLVFKIKEQLQKQFEHKMKEMQAETKKRLKESSDKLVNQLRANQTQHLQELQRKQHSWKTKQRKFRHELAELSAVAEQRDQLQKELDRHLKNGRKLTELIHEKEKETMRQRQESERMRETMKDLQRELQLFKSVQSEKDKRQRQIQQKTTALISQYQQKIKAVVGKYEVDFAEQHKTIRKLQALLQEAQQDKKDVELLAQKDIRDWSVQNERLNKELAKMSNRDEDLTAKVSKMQVQLAHAQNLQHDYSLQCKSLSNHNLQLQERALRQEKTIEQLGQTCQSLKKSLIASQNDKNKQLLMVRQQLQKARKSKMTGSEWLVEKSYMQNQLQMQTGILQSNQKLITDLLNIQKKRNSQVQDPLSPAKRVTELEIVLEEKQAKLERFKAMISGVITFRCAGCQKQIVKSHIEMHLQKCRPKTIPLDISLWIGATSIKEQDGQSYSQYTINVSSNQSIWQVTKRFKQFCKLANELSKPFKGSGLPLSLTAVFNLTISDVDPKRYVKTEEKRKCLQEFLQDCLQHEELKNSPLLFKFLELDRHCQPQKDFLKERTVHKSSTLSLNHERTEQKPKSKKTSKQNYFGLMLRSK